MELLPPANDTQALRTMPVRGLTLTCERHCSWAWVRDCVHYTFKNPIFPLDIIDEFKSEKQYMFFVCWVY